MIHFENKFASVTEEKDYFVMKWTLDSSKMTTEEYKKTMNSYLEIIKKHKPSKLLLDIVDMRFIVTPDIQEWTDINIFAITGKFGLNKIAILAPEDVVTHMSAEQIFEEEAAQKKQNNFFDNKEQAIEWLLN